ncbi:MAG: ABC transporter ATP-binding protein/permease, partial [Pseudomonadales bacterium]|nr:ABC transporter ATP-binding protein/permease [Pseudomonadales bacterium]
MNISTREVWSLLWRSLQFVWPYRYQIGVKILLSILGLSVVLYLPWPLKILIDHVVMGMPIGESPTPFPPYVQPLVDALKGLSPIAITWAIVGISLVGIFLIGAFNNDVRDNAQGNLAQGLDTATQSENQANESGSRISGLIGLFEYRYQLRITHRINHRLRGLIFDRLMRLPITRFADESVGDAVYRVMYDTPAISRVCYDILVTPISSLYVIGLVIYTTEYSFQAVPAVVLLAWIAAPLTLITSFTMTGLSRKRSLASRKAGADTTATVEEGMSNILAVQSLGANDRQRDIFDQDSETSFGKFRSYLALNIILGGLQYGLAVLLGFILFFDVCEAVISGAMSPGDFGLLFAYFLQLYGNTTALGALWFYLQDKLVGMKRVYQIIDTDIDEDIHGDQRIDGPVRELRINSASYAYPDGTEALHEIELSGEVGEMIALVGGTGAGKTTLSYLMPGFIRPAVGKVVINDIDIRDLELTHLRELVTFVFQEPMVFDDTLGANIRLG